MTRIVTTGSRVLRGASPRRATQWIGLSFATTTLAASATAALVSSLNAAALALRPFTIVRTRGVWLVESDQTAATENFVGSLGMAVVSDEASAVGVTAVPTPATELDSDLFFLHQSWIGRFSLIGTDVTRNATMQPFDSKAMRKVNADQDLVITAEAGIGGNGCIVNFVGRMLIKLH